MRVLAKKERAEKENEVRVFFESLNFEIQMRVSQISCMSMSIGKSGSIKGLCFRPNLQAPIGQHRDGAREGTDNWGVDNNHL